MNHSLLSVPRAHPNPQGFEEVVRRRGVGHHLAYLFELLLVALVDKQG